MTVLFGAVLKSTLAWRRQIRVEAKHSQVEWLAESGVARAVAKLNADANYEGEDWQPDVFDDSENTATVTISVAATDQTKITVLARVDGVNPATVERTLTIPNQKDANDD